jgi:pyridoxamine 5'-phosphate oxidase family protein
MNAHRWQATSKEDAMEIFTQKERAYLSDGPTLARIATVGKDGTPHVVPVGWSYNADAQAIEIGGVDLEKTKKYRDVQRNGQAAVVIDDLVSRTPWRVRGIEVRGRAEALAQPRPVIRIHPERVVSWGIESDAIGERHSRSPRPRSTESATQERE